ncbi:MAG: AEC family transporter [Clostridiaceae bacterium]
MIEVFLLASNSIIPIVIIMGIGYILRRKNFIDDIFYKKASKLIFNLCLPSLIFCNIYSIKSFGAIDFNMVWYAIAAVIVVFFMGIITVTAFINDDKQKGVILQCVFRSNFTLLGIAIAEPLGGSGALANLGVLTAFVLPLFNVLGVISLVIFSKDKNLNISWKDVFIKIIKNPLIHAVILGLIVLLVRSFIPTDDGGQLAFSLSENLSFIYNAFENIGRISSPLSLLIMGSQFTFKVENNKFVSLLIGTVWRVVLTPLITIGGAVLLTKYSDIIRCDNSLFPAYLALFASPASTSSAIMAEEMGGDSNLAVQLVAWTNLASIGTFFILIVFLRFLNLI